MGDESILVDNSLDSSGAVAVSRLVSHFKEPTNLLNYLIFSAWLKFMGIAQYVPTIHFG